MRKILIGLILLTLSACAWSTDIYTVAPGDSKQTVIKKLGTPNHASGDKKAEYFWYHSISEFWKKHYVRFVGGKVESYGAVNGSGVESH